MASQLVPAPRMWHISFTTGALKLASQHDLHKVWKDAREQARKARDGTEPVRFVGIGDGRIETITEIRIDCVISVSLLDEEVKLEE